MTAPTIDEQIGYQTDAFLYSGNHLHEAILASLEKLQSIQSQPVPVEPEIVQRVMRRKGKELNEVRNPNITAKECIELANYIDSLQSALKLAQERIKYYEAITTGAEHSAIDKAMSAELLKEVGE